MHNCDETSVYYKLLSDNLLLLKKASNKVGMKTNKETVILLLYKSGKTS
jgi:hypothetical protein